MHALSFHPFLSAWRLSSNYLFLYFFCGVAVNPVCEMEIRTLSLSLRPSLSRHQNEAMPPMFFSDLGVLPNLVSGAERERERGAGRERAECRGRRGGSGHKDERKEDEKWTRGRGNVSDQHKAYDWCKSIWAFSHYIAEPSTIPSFSAEQLLLASGSESADKMACCYYAKRKNRRWERRVLSAAIENTKNRT